MHRPTPIHVWSVAVCLLAILACSPLERRLLFAPTHHDDTRGLTRWLHHGELIGFARIVASPAHAWLLLHGNGGQAADRVYTLPSFERTDSVYVLEYPGYGKRPGKPSRESIDEAAREAYSLLRALHPDRPVCIAGESIGSGPASMLATLGSPPDRIALVVPFDRLTKVAREHFPDFLVDWILRSDWDNVAALSAYHGSVEIYGARDDRIIPVSHAKVLADTVPNGKFSMIEGGHNDWAMPGRVAFRCRARS